MSVLIKFVHRQEILDVSEELGEASFIPQVGLVTTQRVA